jgi:transcriptional regulator with XRE-family HTH domain
MTTEKFPEFLMRITNGAAQVQIARSAGVDPGTVSRWTTGRGAPSPESVIEVCRFFKHSPVEGLIAAGYIDAAELKGVVKVASSIAEISDGELLAEINRRFKHGRTTA